MDIKQKYREEKNADVYCDEWQVEGGSYKDEYVMWLEQRLIEALFKIHMIDKLKN